MPAFQARSGQQTEFRQKGKLYQQLYCTGNGHTPGQAHQRFVKLWSKQEDRANQADIEQYRGKGRHRKLVKAVEYAAGKGHQGNKKDIGEGDAQQFGGQLQLRRIT